MREAQTAKIQHFCKNCKDTSKVDFDSDDENYNKSKTFPHNEIVIRKRIKLSWTIISP